MKGEITYKILKNIEKAVFTTADIFEILFSSRQEVYRRMHGNYFRHGESIDREIVEKVKEKQKFYNLLNYLQKQKLVAKEHNAKNQSPVWKITRKGLDKLEKLKYRFFQRPSKKKYPISKSDAINMVSFDIPEYLRPKREWLRENLKNFGFKMIHKSVWIGKVELPIEFVEDLRSHKLLSYVHIFSVNKIGTISNFKF